MALVEAKCTNCGAKLEVDSTKEVAICPSCNSAFVVEKAINNITNNVTNENHINASNVTIVQNESILVKNGVYEGETKAGKPHGYGVCHYSDGSVYEGDWLAGVRFGEGTIVYEDGSKWTGEWKKDRCWNGQGRYPNWYKGIIDYYEGELKNGKANGNGTWVYCNGKSWTGLIRDNNEITGEGYIVYFDDFNDPYQSYEGKIINGEYDKNGEWNCFDGSFRIDDIRYDISNNTLDFSINDTSLPTKIPNGIRKIKKDCGGIWDHTKIICPKSLTEFNVVDSDIIRNLEEFEAPGIKKVPNNMFCGLQNLRSVKLVNAETIGESAFEECENLVTLEIPNAKTICNSAFKYCFSLQSISIPHVTKIGIESFRGCDLSKEFNISNVVKIGSEALADSLIENLVAPKLKIIDEEAFFCCEKLKNIDAPMLEEIGEYAFRYCTSLNSFSSESVTLIKNYAFDGCSELVKVNCPKAKLDAESNNSFCHFSRCDKLQEIHLSEEVNISNLQTKTSSGGCYVATCVYGSYDCPEVWTLRRYRDYKLASTWYGRIFIKTYYAISPTIVKWFGNTSWFKSICKGKLDFMVNTLQSKGVKSTPYNDHN